MGHTQRSKMANLVFIFCATIFTICAVNGAQTGLSCSVDKAMEDFEKAMMPCLIKSVDAGLMFKIIENMKDLSKLESLDFVCGYQNDFAKLFNCMQHKYMVCLPGGAQEVVRPFLPNESRWKEIVQLVCDNRQLLNDQCMTSDASDKFMGCYRGQLQDMASLFVSVASSKDLTPLLCKVPKSIETCIAANPGTCTANYINRVSQLMELVIQAPKCSSNLDTKMGKALNSLLIHGQPLNFKPEYKVIHNY